jgi:tetratricopeptide (TPR) repeat protein
LKLAGLLEMLRVVREEEPPRPGNKLSTSGELAGISLRRGMEPKKLLNLLRNELDWIVMKALEKDPARRYDSANALALDLQRYLAGEAVQAHPPSTGYRMRKFVRRNKGRVIAACLVIVALVAGLAGTSWQAVRAGRAEGRTAEERDRAIQSEKDARILQAKAEQEEQKARKSAAEATVMNRFFQELTLESRRSVQDGGKWRAKTVDEAVAIIDTEPIRALFADHPLAEADIREWLGSSASSLGGFSVTFATIPTIPGLPKPKGAVTGEYSNGRITMPHDAEAVRQHFERAFELRRAHLGPDHPKTLATMYRLGQLNRSQGRFAQAFLLFGELVTRSNAALGADHNDTLVYRTELAMTYEAADKLDEAFRRLKEIYSDTQAKWGAESEKALNSLDQVARICEKTGNLEEALRLREEGLRGRRKRATGSPDLFVGYALQNVARLHDEMQHYTQTEPLWREALLCVKEDDIVSVEVQASLGLCLLRTNKPAEAEPVLRECLGAREKKQPNRWLTFHTKSLLGESYLGQNRYTEAEPLLLAGYEGMKLRENQMRKNEKIHLAEALARLVQLYDAWGRKELSDGWRKKLEAAKIEVQSPTKMGINGVIE